MAQDDRFARNKPLDDLETSLVREAVGRASLISPEHEVALRHAIAVARITGLDADGGRIPLDDLSEQLADEVKTLLLPHLGEGRAPEPEALASAAPLLQGRAREVRRAMQARIAGKAPAARLDEEIHQKALVLILGGGGGVGYVHLGANLLLEELDIEPKLIAGASMGAILGIFRARKRGFDQGEMVSVLRSISYRKLFRFLEMESRYGMPGALRLYLRAGIGRHFLTDDGAPMRFRDLTIPTLVSISGIPRGKLPRPLESYEKGLSLRGLDLLRPHVAKAKVTQAMNTLLELAQQTNLVSLHLGHDAASQEFDVLDAVGFSAAVPGVIHYDVVRDDPRMHQMLQAVLDQHGLFRLIDGGVSDNVPARAAWNAVQSGTIGTRNAFLLALDGFAPRLHMGMWMPLMQFAKANVDRNAPYAHLLHRFRHSLSPLDLVPSVDRMLGIAETSREELLPYAPWLRRLMQRLPAIDVDVARLEGQGLSPAA